MLIGPTQHLRFFGWKGEAWLTGRATTAPGETPVEVISQDDARAAIELASRGLKVFEEATEEMRNLLRNPEHYAELVQRVRASFRPMMEELNTVLDDN